MLVYEYMSNGSLEKHLFKSELPNPHPFLIMKLMSKELTRS